MNENHALSQELSNQSRRVWDLECALTKALERVEELEGIGVICNQRGEEINGLEQEVRRLNEQVVGLQETIGIRGPSPSLLVARQQEIDSLKERLAGMTSDRNYYQKRWEEAQTKLVQIRRVL